MSEKTISVGSVSKVIALISAIVGAWLFLTTHLVMAGEYQEDRLEMQAVLVAIQVDLLDVRIKRATKDNDVEEVKELEYHKQRLERHQDMILNKQLDQ